MKHLIFILSLFFVNCINAQNFTEADIHLWGAGISHEKEITENISIRGSFNYDGKYYIVDNQLLPGAVSYYIFQPEFVIEPRWYHNKANREKNKKNVAFNAKMESQTGFKKSTYERQNKTANNVHLFCLKATLWQSANYC